MCKYEKPRHPFQDCACELARQEVIGAGRRRSSFLKSWNPVLRGRFRVAVNCYGIDYSQATRADSHRFTKINIDQSFVVNAAVQQAARIIPTVAASRF